MKSIIASFNTNKNISKTRIINFSIKRGDTFQYPIILKKPLTATYIVDTETQYLLDKDGNIIYDIDGNPIIVNENNSNLILVSIANTIIQGHIKKNKKDIKPIELFQINTNLVTNSIILKLDANDSKKIPPGTYYYDIELYDLENNSHETIIEGTIDFSQDVTEFIDFGKGIIENNFKSEIKYKFIDKLKTDNFLNNLINYKLINNYKIESAIYNTLNYYSRQINTLNLLSGIYNQINYSMVNKIKFDLMPTSSTQKLVEVSNNFESSIYNLINYYISKP